MTSITLLSSCEGEAYLGELKVRGLENVFVKLWQDREFDKATAIKYQVIVGEKEETAKRFLLGTDAYERNTKNFQASSFDSIVYITFHSDYEICALYDLKQRQGYPNIEKDWKKGREVANKLLKRLQEEKNSKFEGKWKK